ncbi:transcriptional regulator opi1 [Exophiala xenobiotica]|uniref:Transcriptional regulator opi1 n=1 Tax=Vermiconidia calcicola TaxID=1690605 RepID=A0AAV9PQZ1_9PEZI|nr:transcriptional regulator opi1 [Exophiala xenobiotica]KAK5298976.1 transcriptional regulator opi1 [Exophiala xenobiotica]KAK5334664.1 transcriptional regulator opi1 [Exophiala xenobiotica]KAK5528024.1 transcriptional regulator opi1 [Vermiconidia calcicola]
MDSQSPNPPYAVPPPFSPPLTAKRSSTDTHKPASIDMDMMRSDERSTRAASVLSGMSAEDMEAAETLNSLHQRYHSPRQSQPAPTLFQTQSTFGSDQSEPLLRLFTSQYPLAGSLINGSLSAYKTTQSYIPGAEWTERNVGLPLAGTVARISGVEGGLRWALQPKRDSRSSTGAPQTPDVEKGYADITPGATQRSSSEMAYTETLPAYNPGDRSPPYSETQIVLQSRERQPPPNWRQQLVISTSGLGIAMSDESIRSLRYCLSWLRWANGRLGEAIQNIKDLLERWDEGVTPGEHASPMSLASMTQSQQEQRQAALSARIAALKVDVLQTLKHVVGIVSNYAGGALPQNARDLVHRHLISLPQRFTVANMSSNDEPSSANDSTSEAAKSGKRVMVLAQEGLDMMTQVSRVVNDTLVSAEGWCERLGRTPAGQGGQQPQLGQLAGGGDEKMDHDHDRGRLRSETMAPSEGGADRAQEKDDVHMQM